MSEMLIITGGPLWAGPGRSFPRGLVAVEGGKVVYAGAAGGFAAPEGAETLDTKGGMIMPGLVNAHCHGPMVLFRGLADDLPLETWLTEHMFPAEGRWIDQANAELGAELAAAEMLLSGTTTVCDAYFCMHGVARAYQRAGMRAVVAHGVIDFPAPGISDPASKFEVLRGFVRDWQGRDPLVTPALFAHSTYTCSPETLRGVAGLAAELGVIWQTHLAETAAEVEQVRAATGHSPVGHLESLGLLEGLSGAVHCVHLQPGEVELLARRGVAMIACPESNMKLASGWADCAAALRAGATLALGTDGAASNNDLDLLAEARTLALKSKVLSADPAAMPAESALTAATLGSARALGLDGVCGQLRPGLDADLVVLSPPAAHQTPGYSPASALVYAASGADVRHVFVAGRQVVRDRQVLTLDVNEVMARVGELAAQIKPGS